MNISSIPYQPFFNHPHRALFLRQLHFNDAGISLLNLLRNRPFYVFIKKWVLTSAAFKRLNIGFIPGGISQRDGDVTQPAQVADTTDSRTFRDFQEPGFGRANSSMSCGA